MENVRVPAHWFVITQIASLFAMRFKPLRARNEPISVLLLATEPEPLTSMVAGRLRPTLSSRSCGRRSAEKTGASGSLSSVTAKVIVGLEANE
jgi:hypothetical protein